MKRRRVHKQDATEKQILYENRTTECTSGIKLYIGSTPATKKKVGKKTKQTHCKCGLEKHLTSNHSLYTLNKNNVLLAATKTAKGKGDEKEGTDSKILATEEI